MGEICKQVSVGFVCHHVSLTPQVAKTMCNCKTRGGEGSNSCTTPVIMGLRIRNQGGTPTERNGSFLSQGSFKLSAVVK